jgi:hypothetical protein
MGLHRRMAIAGGDGGFGVHGRLLGVTGVMIEPVGTAANKISNAGE